MKILSNTLYCFQSDIASKMNNQLFKKPYYLIIGLIVFYPASLLSADSSTLLIAYNCFSCHGEKLVANELSLPHSTHHLHQTLLAFKYDRKPASIMNRITKGYTDSQLKAVAAYLISKD